MNTESFALTDRLERLVESGLGPRDIQEYRENLKELAARATQSRDEIRLMSKIFRALSHPTRLKIIKLLGIREMCVCEIMAVLEATQPTTSHHLNILESIGLVKERREGKWIFYSIADSKLSQDMARLITHNP